MNTYDNQTLWDAEPFCMVPALLSHCRGSNPLAPKVEPSGKTPKRFVSIYHPDGVGVPLKEDPAWKDWSWFPHGGEKDFKFTKVLDVLEPLRSDVTVYAGLSHPAVRRVHGHSNADQYLTGANTKGHGPYKNSISLDQVYAEYIGDETRHSSLVMSTNGGIGGPRGAQTQSFNREGRAIPAMNKPKQISISCCSRGQGCLR